MKVMVCVSTIEMPSIFSSSARNSFSGANSAFSHSPNAARGSAVET